MEHNPNMAFAPSAPPAPSGAVSMGKLESVLQRFEITIAQAINLCPMMERVDMSRGE